MTVTPGIDIDTIAEGVIQKVHLNETLLIPSSDVIDLIYQLKEFELGRAMLTIGGLTSSWVDYICHNEVSPTGHPLETWFLSKSPKIKAARERYYITRDALQFHLRSNIVFCVMPCGVISKVAELDYSNIKNIKIIGYDNDIHGLVRAEMQMQPLVDQGKVNLLLLKKNIWLLDDYNQHDLIISNRLSVLEADSQKVLGLFEKYYAALKRNGIFISSFFTPSPLENLHTSPWKNVDVNDVLTEHSIFVDIMDFRPAARPEGKMITLLQKAGFEIVDIFYDTHHIYPTIIARKA
ncbi:MAG: hypothetical protein Q8Q56_01665 [Alphaproteobacteria bacterium]|nr:hypothetical protein [Alphaproteobacteria bacterium]